MIGLATNNYYFFVYEKLFIQTPWDTDKSMKRKQRYRKKENKESDRYIDYLTMIDRYKNGIKVRV